MGDGVIDIPRIRGWVEAQGFAGYSEVEIFSTGHWWQRDGGEVLDTCVDRHKAGCDAEAAIPAPRPGAFLFKDGAKDIVPLAQLVFKQKPGREIQALAAGTPANSFSRAAGSTGLTRCASKPASSERR